MATAPLAGGPARTIGTGYEYAGSPTSDYLAVPDNGSTGVSVGSPPFTCSLPAQSIATFVGK